MFQNLINIKMKYFYFNFQIEAEILNEIVDNDCRLYRGTYQESSRIQ